jgi:radical SAM superfamily enzyme YgiQ (UPF0313 family)
MVYVAPLYRPPSEASSLILQVTIGCSHNQCTFCYMYKTKKYRIKSLEEIKQHIQWGKSIYPHARRIFLADGNVLSMPTQDLIDVLHILFEEFPYLERVTAYAGPKDLLAKSDEELAQIRRAGLSMLYLGVESGSPKVLANIQKGVSPEEMILAGQKARQAGFILSCTVILGIGGKELTADHAVETAKVISAMQPHYLGALTLMIEEKTKLKAQIESGEFQLLNPLEVIDELIMMIEPMELENCVFRSNHASNYLYLKGTLNKDKEKLLRILKEAKNNSAMLAAEENRLL